MLLTANPAISTLEAVVTGAGQVLLAFSVVFALLNCFSAISSSRSGLPSPAFCWGG